MKKNTSPRKILQISPEQYNKLLAILEGCIFIFGEESSETANDFFYTKAEKLKTVFKNYGNIFKVKNDETIEFFEVKLFAEELEYLVYILLLFINLDDDGAIDYFEELRQKRA